jgi:DNA replication and repair protein RecF
MITKLHLRNFRNFKTHLFEFSPATTIIIGPNATGKTNILESLHLLSTGKSFKARIEEEMVNYHEEIARIKGLIGEDKLEIVLTRGQINLGTDHPERVARKRLLINGVGKRLIDFSGVFKVVLFAPQDLDLVTESPTLRRKFLDSVLSQVDREYRRALLSYDKGLRQRNRLLFRIREEGLSRGSLTFWDSLLIKNGNYLTSQRANLLDFVNHSPDFNGEDFSVAYDHSAISESRLAAYAAEEVAAATTLVGPHRDDFCLFLKKKKVSRPLDRFGSRGEQRMSVLWLKLAELAFIEKQSDGKPTLLLDDIFSELDEAHRSVVTKLTQSQQTIITTTDPTFIKSKSLATIHL